MLSDFNVSIIYIFGSFARNEVREDSDIDIAFLCDKEINEYECFMKGQEIADAVKREVDLIDLKKASTVFIAQVVGTGKVIYCNDEVKRGYFEMRALKEYALLNEERKVILDRIKESGTVYGK
ncbi:MAG: type VII toxin-antitoxin system MntA family adenylyltransferase antitoxin [Sarcina sp.]